MIVKLSIKTNVACGLTLSYIAQLYLVLFPNFQGAPRKPAMSARFVLHIMMNIIIIVTEHIVFRVHFLGIMGYVCPSYFATLSCTESLANGSALFYTNVTYA